MARAYWICTDRLQHYAVSGDRVFSVLPHVWMEAAVTCRPAFPESKQRTCTLNEYVKALYEWLRECLKLVQESATKEANRQKRLYDRKIGAVELRPGDRVLVGLDAFRGQCRKLKN